MLTFRSVGQWKLHWFTRNDCVNKSVSLKAINLAMLRRAYLFLISACMKRCLLHIFPKNYVSPCQLQATGWILQCFWWKVLKNKKTNQQIKGNWLKYFVFFFFGFAKCFFFWVLLIWQSHQFIAQWIRWRYSLTMYQIALYIDVHATAESIEPSFSLLAIESIRFLVVVLFWPAH